MSSVVKCICIITKESIKLNNECGIHGDNKHIKIRHSVLNHPRAPLPGMFKKVKDKKVEEVVEEGTEKKKKKK